MLRHLLPCLFAGAIACGGGVSSPSPGAASSSGSPGEASTSRSTNPLCTAEIPRDGAACPSKLLGYCEYGSSPTPGCNTKVECVTRGSSCNGADDCARMIADRVWSVSAPDPALCNATPEPPRSPPPASCPRERPFLGTACTGDSLCLYSCSWPSFVCVDGFWSEGVARPGCEEDQSGG
jgi:hypothetical protein